MTESRSELIQWMNELLNTNYTRVEQLGSGAAYCQVIDSIYGNVPMSKVNFAAKQEWEFLPNYKVLQETFKKNKIDKPIPVEKLVRCKMQDNLEFLQWIKKFWDTTYGGEPYDPDARRLGQAAAPPPLHGQVAVGAVRNPTATAAPARRAGAAAAAGAGAAGGGGAAAKTVGVRARATPSAVRAAAGGGARAAGAAAGAAGSRASSSSATAAGAGMPDETILALTSQMDEMKVSVDSLERERDFYFGKLRDIEILVSDRLTVLDTPDQPPEEGAEDVMLKRIQAILYATDEGFEVPEGREPSLDEAETF